MKPYVVKQRAFDVIPACPESFLFTVLRGKTIPDERE
jgi:hypothetical protein